MNDEVFFVPEPGTSQRMLTIGLSACEVDALTPHIARQEFSITSYLSITDALQSLFYDDYVLCIIKQNEISENDVFLIQEAHAFCPWRGIILLADQQPEPHEEQIFSVITPGTLSRLHEIIGSLASKKEHWSLPISAQQINSILQLFRVMRTSSLAAVKQQNHLDALDLFIEKIAIYLHLTMIGIAYRDSENPFFLLHLSKHASSAMQQEITQTVTNRLKKLGYIDPQVHLRMKTDSDLRPCPATNLRISFFPIILEHQILGYLAINVDGAKPLQQLYFSFMVHIIHYISMIFSDLMRLRNLAFKDPLTQLYNRRYMEEACNRLFLLGHRYGHTVAVLFIDIDHFKQINDRRGHDAGDMVLSHIAEALVASLRESDIVARYGGDEFIVILPHASAVEAMNTANRILHDCSDSPVIFKEEKISITVSIGVALSSLSERLKSFDSIIEQADEAMLNAKATGGNQVLQWTPKRDPEALRKLREEASRDLKSPSIDTPTPPNNKGCILLVDDDATILTYMDHIIRANGYLPLIATSGDEATKALLRNPGSIDVLITDINMPDMNGFELIRSVQHTDASIVSIVITADVNTERAILAVRHGAHDILQKPFTGDQLLLALERAMEFHRLADENKKFQQQILSIVNLKSSENRRSLERVKTAYQYTLDTMVAMLDAREKYTSQHSLRVRDLTVLMARAMKFKPIQIKQIAQGALLHDIGKIGIPDAILQKPGPLTPVERTTIEKHPQIGYSFLESNTYLAEAAKLILAHHERWDGSGYPNQLEGTHIPIGARIFSIIDSYDAIRSKRVYKPSVSPEKALAIIQENSNLLFDPDIVSVFSKLHQEIESAGNWPE